MSTIVFRTQFRMYAFPQEVCFHLKTMITDGNQNVSIYTTEQFGLVQLDLFSMDSVNRVQIHSGLLQNGSVVEMGCQPLEYTKPLILCLLQVNP